MTEIKIIRLSLENFKCHRSLLLTLDGGNAAVYGDNATGKTSIYDALTWLLFGKDSVGNGEKNIEIKPLDSTGAVSDHEAVTQVEAVLQVDGQELTLRRTYQEVWTTKRGSSEATYDGNTSEYFIDGVPCKKNAFQERVDALVSEETFRMLTSVSHFAGAISWQERRAVLFRLAGIVDDRQILSTQERFIPLLESMGRLDLDAYKKKLLVEKKQLVGAKTDIPARISECQKTIEQISSLDFDLAKAQAQALQSKLDGISARILAIEHDSAAEEKRLAVREAELALSALENENKAFRDAQDTGRAAAHSNQISLTVLKTRLEKKQKEADAESASVKELDGRVEEAREKWIAINAESLGVSSVCPTCGQSLPQEKLQSATEAAQAQKQKRLDMVLDTANALKEARQQAQKRLAHIDEELSAIRSEMDTLLKNIAEAENNTAPLADMPDYSARKTAITDTVKELSAQLADMMQDSYAVKTQLVREQDALRAQLAEQNGILAKQSVLDYAGKRVEALREEARNGAACLEAIEKMLFLMDEYTRYKTRFVEESINGKFRLARFRLFREQANGGVEDRCDVTYDGIPYMGINNGMKVNLGVDIINTLSQAYGVRVPLFVDNAESVTNLEKCGSQIIRLVVSAEDKELRVEYEFES